MTVVHSKTLTALFVVLHSITILKLTAIIDSNCLECALGEFRQKGIQRPYCVLCRFSPSADDNLIASCTLSKHEEGFFLSSCFSYNAIHFPMTEGTTVIDKGWAAFDRQTSGGTSGDPTLFSLCRLFLFGQVCIGDIGDLAPIDITIQRGSGHRPFTTLF